jgi:peptide/nickel transport system substrate-binding protein
MRKQLFGCAASAILLLSSCAPRQAGGELRFCLRAEPKTLNPMLVSDESSEAIRYLTGGVLIRVNRVSQALEPELATSWVVSKDGRDVTFQIREGIAFSDGTPFSAEDVAYTFRMLMDPAIHSPTGDSFRSGEGATEAQVLTGNRVSIRFPAPVAGMERLFDQVAILSSKSPLKEAAVLGPFAVSEHKAGSYLLLRRNPRYWKRDASGRQLPYLDAVRLELQQNRDIEILRFRRGEIHLINSLDPEDFDRLVKDLPASAVDAGPGMDTEQVWFNQYPKSPIAAYKKAWFQSTDFRRAVSEAIHRGDLCKVVYRGHAEPAAGPMPLANRFWFREGMKPHALDPEGSMRRLEQAGFRRSANQLYDRQGHPVEFSLITNSGNKSRERMAAMIQQDLARLGIKLNVVTLDFPSIIERFTRTFDYEACLLGLVNVDLDPNAQMNIWLSSSSNHQWNPNQKSPATQWEAEIDRLMQAQASTVDPKERKASFDRVQEIVWEQAPFLYLVNRNSLSAVSPSLRNVAVSVLRPQTFWNVEHLYLAPVAGEKRR